MGSPRANSVSIARWLLGGYGGGGCSNPSDLPGRLRPRQHSWAVHDEWNVQLAQGHRHWAIPVVRAGEGPQATSQTEAMLVPMGACTPRARAGPVGTRGCSLRSYCWLAPKACFGIYHCAGSCALLAPALCRGTCAPALRPVSYAPPVQPAIVDSYASGYGCHVCLPWATLRILRGGIYEYIWVSSCLIHHSALFF